MKNDWPDADEGGAAADGRGTNSTAAQLNLRHGITTVPASPARNGKTIGGVQ